MAAEVWDEIYERLGEVLLDVVGEGFQRRDVHHLDLVAQRALEPLPHQVVDRREERRERFPRPGRGGDQDVPALMDQRPSAALWLRWLAKAGLEPALNGGMKTGEGHGSNMAEENPKS